MKDKFAELKKQVNELKEIAERNAEDKRTEIETLAVGRFFAYDKVLKLIAKIEEKAEK